MKRAIVTGGTKDDVAPMAVFAINIRNTNAHLFDELIIFHDGISEKDQRLIKSIFPTRFIRYFYPNASRNDEILSHFSYMVFCKYECFRLLDEYDEVVWSDYDVVVLGRLDEFVNSEKNKINVLDNVDSLRTMFYTNIVNESILKYNLDVMGIGTPLFALSDLNGYHSDICNWCYQKTGEWDIDLYLPEQCIFSLAIQEFQLEYKVFPFNKYACYPTKAVGDEIILHAAGQFKFWNGMKNEIWDSMYVEWISLGGTKYSDFRKKVKRRWLFFITRMRGIRGRSHK